MEVKEHSQQRTKATSVNCIFP